MKQDDDLNLDGRPSDQSPLMPAQVGQHTPALVPPHFHHPTWTGQTMDKPQGEATPSSSFPSSSRQGYGFKTERPDGTTADSSRSSPQQNAFQFPQGFSPATAFPGPPPLAFANGVPVMGFPNGVPSPMFPGGMPGLAINNDALVWRMLMETYSRMTGHRNELMKNQLQMQNSAEHPMQFATPDQRAMARGTASEHQQRSRPSFSSTESFRQQSIGLEYGSPNNTLDLSASRKKPSRARRMGKKSSPMPQLDNSQNSIQNFSSTTTVPFPHAYSPPYSPFAFPNSLPRPHFASTSSPNPSSISIKSEPVIDTHDLLPATAKESFSQLEMKSPGLRSGEVSPLGQQKDTGRSVIGSSAVEATEMGNGNAEFQQSGSSLMRESLSRSSAQETHPEVALKLEADPEELLLYTSGGRADVSVMHSGSPFPDRRLPSPGENPNGRMDSTGSSRTLDMSLSGAPSQPVTGAVRRKKILRCRRCSFVTVEKEAFYKHKYEHFPSDRLMACTECTFVTQLKHHFQYHINTHKGVRPYPCSLCDYRGTNLAMLKSHLKTHKKYNCADCGYSAASTDMLQLHMSAENHKPAPVFGAMRGRNRVGGLGNIRRSTNSRRSGALKARRRFALNGSQAESVSLPITDAFSSPMNVFSQSQSFGASQSSPQNQPVGRGGSSGVWPGSMNLWPATFPVPATSGQLAPSFALPQPLAFGTKPREDLVSACEFCSFSTSSRSRLMHHVTSQHRHLLNSVLQSGRLPLDGSPGSGLMSDKRKSTPPRTGGSPAQPSPYLHSLPRFSSSNGHAPEIHRSTDTSVIAIEEMNSQASQCCEANPVFPLDLSCVQEPCQKQPSRRKGVARKLAVEQVDDEDVAEYFSNFLPIQQELCNSSVSSATQCIPDSREHLEMRFDQKMETESWQLIQESQMEEQVDHFQQASNSSTRKLLSKTDDKSSLISTKSNSEKSVPVPSRLDVKQQNVENNDDQLVAAKRTAAATNKSSPAKTYKCHHCGIIFLDYILYSMHNGYHNFDDPLRCNICGRRSNDIHEFYTHIGKYAHPES